jgi:TonB family protein
MKATFPAALVLLGAACATPPARSSAAPVDVTREATAQSAATGVYFEFQVEKPARQLEGSCVPLYPDSLRAARTKGEVVAHFVVDTAGRPEAETFKVVRSSHAAFTSAVRDALPCMGYTPATIRGRRVRQLVQQPFTFDLSK